jgi:hypothetical protein
MIETSSEQQVIGMAQVSTAMDYVEEALCQITYGAVLLGSATWDLGDLGR